MEAIESTIAKVKPNRTVFLGDYFDSFFDTVEMTDQTCKWLRSSLDKPNRIHLLGNHDIPYLFDFDGTWRKNGWSEEKNAIVRSYNMPIDKFKMSYFEDGWLMTHAGIDAELFKIESVDGAKDSCVEALAALNAGREHPLLSDLGCLWIRWNRWEPTLCNQIFGHTAGDQIRERRKNGLTSICLDAPARYAILEAGKITYGYQK